MPLTVQEILSDLPQVIELVGVINDFIAKEKVAVSFAERQKLSEPVQEKLAELIDAVKAQAAS